MKSIIALLASALLAFSAQAANGPIDGIYSCTVSAAGTIVQPYISISGRPDGQSLWVVAAVYPSTSFYGYGIGTVSGNKFTGSTMFLMPFDFTITGTTLSGTVTALSNGRSIVGSVVCNLIW